MADAYPAKFEEFWKAYPRRVAKLSALKAWQKHGMEDDMYLAQAAIDDVEKRSRKHWWSKDKSKIPHPATWINSQRWYDEGWESEVEQRDGHVSGEVRYNPAPPLPDMPWQQAMFGRLMWVYVLKAGGLVNPDRALDIRSTMMAEFVPAFEEDVRLGHMEPEQVGEQLADLFLARLDEAYGLQLRASVLGLARRKAA